MSIVSCRYGEFSIPDRDDLILNALRKYGEWAQQEIAVLAQIIRPGDTVIDAGAFIGTHARAFSQIVGKDGVVLAFEPNPTSFEYLLENANLAQYANITTYQIALGDRLYWGTLEQGQSDQNLGGTRISEGGADAQDIVVRVQCLDDFDFGRIGFIKADLEGMEFLMLLGAEKTVSRDHPVIFLEVNNLQASIPVLGWAHARDYMIFGVISAAFNPDNFNGFAENIFGEVIECGLLLIHRTELAERESALSAMNLPVVDSADSLALLLLHKPQYFHETLEETLIAKSLGLDVPIPLVRELVAQVAERDGQIISLNQGIAERDGQIISLNQGIAERDGQIISLNQGIAERDGQFDAQWYLKQNPDVAMSGMDPYKHYILFGKAEGRQPAPDAFLLPPAFLLMSDAGLIATAAPIARTHPVAVLLPVYRDAELTKACIESAMPGVLDVPDAVLVILNDASPEPEMVPTIDMLAARWPDRIEVLTNEHNLGFVATVNKGMKSYKHHDIVLLNSDVILPQGWLNRLIVEAYSRPRIATVTPLSNNATICTFPEFLQENLLPFNLSVNEVDAAFRGSRLSNVEAPTGVGFCMYLRRECLDEVGYFNEARFGRGYGEENDFCQRAIKQGWLNLITPNLYVFHKGGVSYGPEKALLVETAMQVIDELHANYHSDVQTFIRSDPLKEARLLRLSRLLASTPIPKVLHVSHGLGGGVKQHIAELADYLSGKNLAFSLVLTPQEEAEICTLRFGFKNTSDDIAIHLPRDFEYLLQVLRSVGLSLVHFHHVMNVHPLLRQLPKELHVQHRLTIHDFYLLNGNPTLTDETGVFTEGRIDALFNPLYPLPKGVTPKVWRDSHRSFVEGAELVVFPSAETKRLFGEYFRIKHPIVAHHVEAMRDIGRPPKRFVPKSSYVIGALGALSREKGADYLEGIARYASKAGLPLTFVLIGYAYRPLDKIKATGPYQADEISGLIHEHECDILLFPARGPETYSYTLSYALESGLPIMAPALGAFPERLAGRENVKLFEHGTSPAILLEQLRAFISALEAGMAHPSPPHSKKCTNPDFYETDYLKNAPRLTPGLQGAWNSIPQVNLNTRSLYRLTHSRSIRESILYGIWRVYTFPGIRKVGAVIPYGFRRFVKRALSKRPMHEIAGKR